MRSKQILVTLTYSLILGSTPCYSQFRERDEFSESAIGVEKVRSKALNACESLASHSSVKLSAIILQDGRSDVQRSVVVQSRGKNVWEEQTESVEGEEKKFRDALRNAVKCDLPIISAFANGKSYSFNPFLLEMTVAPSKKLIGGKGLNLLPKNWLRLNGGGLRLMGPINGSKGGLGGKQLSHSLWELTYTEIGKNLKPELQAYLAYREISVTIDRESGFLPVSFQASGGKSGVTYGKIQWKRNGEGHWFPYNLEQYFKVDGEDMLVSKWSIKDISFNAKDCREKFNNLEEIVPLGTAIRVAGAGNLKELSYKGGLKGEVEHSQLRLARSKLLKKKLQEKPQ